MKYLSLALFVPSNPLDHHIHRKRLKAPRPLSGEGAEAMSKQLDRIEEKLDELNKLVGSVAWYFEEALDYLAVLDQELLLVEEKLGVESPRLHAGPTRARRGAPPEG
jgi:hypothetical protein